MAQNFTFSIMKEYLFVGETRSEQAKKNGWCWQMGVSTAKVLFNALREVNIIPEDQEYTNLWDDNGNLVIPETDLKIVGMGQKVHKKLEELGIEHIDIIHPAARGKIRKTELYNSHIKENL